MLFRFSSELLYNLVMSYEKLKFYLLNSKNISLNKPRRKSFSIRCYLSLKIQTDVLCISSLYCGPRHPEAILSITKALQKQSKPYNTGDNGYYITIQIYKYVCVCSRRCLYWDYYQTLLNIPKVFDYNFNYRFICLFIYMI